MKVTLVSVIAVLFAIGCGDSGDTDKPSNTAGASSGGVGGSSAGAGGVTTSGGQSSAGAGASTGGVASGGGGAGSGGTTAGAGGAPVGGGGAGGAGGASGGSKGFQCPATSEAPKLTGLTPVKVMGVPPADDFNNMNNDGTNIEGAVWVGDALYVSEINFSKANPPPSRVLKITADDKVTVAIMADSGTNGLAINAAGELFGAVHKDGSISKLSLSGGAATPVVSKFMNLRFDSPNDLTFHTNGTIYFTDPDYQSAKPAPQAATRAYRVPAGGEPVEIEQMNQPNGITLSKAQDALFIASASGIKKYPVMADGTLGAGANFGQGGGVDGMVIDCGDNLYAAQNGVTVYSPAGQSLGSITISGLPQTTNVAFGGADHKTLYVTGMGSKEQKGLFKIPMNVAGFPY